MNRIELTKRQRVIGLVGLILVGLIALYWTIPAVWRLQTGPIEVVRWPKTGEQVFQIGPDAGHWVPIESVSYHVLHAIVVAEDARFYEHHGLDFTEIQNSIALNWEKGAYVRGASTITQQVVKMAFLSQEKSLFRKFREALGALLLEQLLTKEQILEWYINLVEFGDGVFGIHEAAAHYFQIEPELLTIQQGANLALVLPSPNTWSEGLKKRELTPFGHRRYAHIIEEMYRQGFITEKLKEIALATGDFGRPIKPHLADTDDTVGPVREESPTAP
jgi:monofunctional biosynthetic peptidoglycan transglycosylase